MPDPEIAGGFSCVFSLCGLWVVSGGWRGPSPVATQSPGRLMVWGAVHISALIRTSTRHQIPHCVASAVLGLSLWRWLWRSLGCSVLSVVIHLLPLFRVTTLPVSGRRALSCRAEALCNMLLATITRGAVAGLSQPAHSSSALESVPLDFWRPPRLGGRGPLCSPSDRQAQRRKLERERQRERERKK